MKIFLLDDLISANLSKSTKPKISGIYVWGVIAGTKYIPLYVGKHNNIPQRLFEHLTAWKGGSYWVPKWDDLIQNNKKWNFVHKPENFKDFKELVSINKEAQITIDNVITNFFCCWKELGNYKTDRPKDKEIALATLFLKNHQLLISHKNKNPMVEQFALEFYEEWLNLIL